MNRQFLRGRTSSLLTVITSIFSAQLAWGDVSITPASGGTSISADRAADSTNPTWTGLGGVTIAEKGNKTGDIGTGTLVLKVPAGFEFNTNVTPDITFSAGQNITSATIAVTDSSTLTITLAVSGSNKKDTLKIGTSTHIQVRPLSGAPLVSGSIYRPAVGGGTATIVGVVESSNPDGSGGTSFGDLATVAGATAQLSFETPPPARAFTTTPFTPAPAIRLEDQFGNLRTSDNTSVVRAVLKAGAGILSGTNATASAGVATFTNLTYNLPEIISLTFTNSGVSLDSEDIQVSLAGSLFYDSFARTNDPGDPAPWLVQSGTWQTSAGKLLGGSNAPNSYGFVYLTNSWSNYIFQAQIQLPANAFGAAIGGRLDPATGAHYTAWLYPDNSSGGPNVIRLIKFSDWANYTVLAQAGVASVGTNAHTLKLLFQDDRLAVFYDGLRILSTTDTDTNRYLAGGLVLGFWTAETAYQVAYDDALVMAYNGAVASDDAYAVIVGTTLTVPAPGVLANDLVAGTNTSALLVTAPLHGEFTLNPDGAFTYTPTNFAGTDSFTYLASDGVSTSVIATVTLKVAQSQPPQAAADTYSMFQRTSLIVPAPGVLANDTDPQGIALSAVLVSGPTVGALNLEPDGGFVFTPPADFAGDATFTYTASNGATNSSPATVTITVTPPGIPTANPDNYGVPGDTVLTLAAPGVLANDTDPNGQSLTALLSAAPASGTLLLNPNGSFNYYPAPDFTGDAIFSYRAADTLATSAPVSVTISVGPIPNPLFADDFTRTNDPGDLGPWSAPFGNWLVTGGALTAGTNTEFTYGYLCTTNGWVDYAVQAAINFPPGAYGGGLGGRLDPATGAHYAAWLYPADSTGGSNVLRLYKFQNYTTYGYNSVPWAPMAEATVPDIGTNWHTVKLLFQSSQITAYYDGAPVITNTDFEPLTYLGGGVSVEQWTDAAGYQMQYDDVLVAAFSAPAQPGLLSIQPGPAGTFILSYHGNAEDQTILQSATSLAAPVLWTPVLTNVADLDGRWSYTNSPAPQSQQFYRTVQP